MAKQKKKDEDTLEDELLEQQEKEQEELHTHQDINHGLSGDLVDLQKGSAHVVLETTQDMAADSVGLVHGGFVFSAADFAAMAAVNEPNVVLVGSDCQFLSPVRVGDNVDIRAKVRHSEGRKRNVNVVGHVHDIKVFDGIFKTVITEKHVLKLKLLDEEDNKKDKKDKKEK